MDGKDFELPEPPPGVIWTRDDYKLPEEGIMKVTYISSKRTAKLSDALDEATCSALRDFTTEYAENPRRPVLQLGLDALQRASGREMRRSWRGGADLRFPILKLRQLDSC